MKSFILAINRYKKWIVLGLSIITLVLFCFPIYTLSTPQGQTYFLPFFAYNIKSIVSLISGKANLSNNYISTQSAFISIASILMLTSIITSIVCIVFLFKRKEFYFFIPLLFAFATTIINSLSIKSINEKVVITFNFRPTAIIFLILLILDIVYLCLERKYLKENKQEPEEVVKTF